MNAKSRLVISSVHIQTSISTPSSNPGIHDSKPLGITQLTQPKRSTAPSSGSEAKRFCNWFPPSMTPTTRRQIFSAPPPKKYRWGPLAGHRKNSMPGTLWEMGYVYNVYVYIYIYYMYICTYIYIYIYIYIWGPA